MGRRIGYREQLYWYGALGFMPKTTDEIDAWLARKGFKVDRPFGAKIPSTWDMERKLGKDTGHQDPKWHIRKK